MSKTKKLQAIITGLASSSVLADAIVDRMSRHASTSATVEEAYRAQQQDVATLKAEIAQLTSYIQLLQQSVSYEEETAIDDEEAASFLVSMQAKLHDMTLSELRFGYTAGSLSQYPRNVRVLIATALVNLCTSKGFKPEPLWSDLISKQGAF